MYRLQTAKITEPTIDSIDEMIRLNYTFYMHRTTAVMFQYGPKEIYDRYICYFFFFCYFSIYIYILAD